MAWSWSWSGLDAGWSVLGAWSVLGRTWTRIPRVATRPLSLTFLESASLPPFRLRRSQSHVCLHPHHVCPPTPPSPPVCALHTLSGHAYPCVCCRAEGRQFKLSPFDTRNTTLNSYSDRHVRSVGAKARSYCSAVRDTPCCQGCLSRLTPSQPRVGSTRDVEGVRVYDVGLSLCDVPASSPHAAGNP